jgi:phosphonate transport system substrate-binding protein
MSSLAARRLLKRVLASLALVSTAAAAGPEPLTLGSVAMDIPAVMHQRLRPLAQYLGEALRRPVQVKPAPDLSSAVDEIARGEVDVAYLTPVAYVNAQRAGNVRIVAKTVTKGQSTFKLMIVTRADSKIRSVRDLAGKRFAFGDAAAILQRAAVVNAGIRLEQFGSYRFLGHYDNIARGVLNGDFDAGILKDTSAYQWQEKGLRIVHASPDLPPYNIVVSRKLDPATASAIQRALLELDVKRPGHREIIKGLDPGYDGFAAATDADYDVVRQLVAPFEK